MHHTHYGPSAGPQSTEAAHGPWQGLFRTVLAALGAAVVLAACGGGGSDSEAPTVAVAGPDADPVGAAEDDGSTELGIDAVPDARIQAFRDGQDKRWTDESMCTDAQLVGPFDNSVFSPEERLLVNRHKACGKFLTHPLRIRLTLMRPRSNEVSAWRWPDSATKDYENYEYWDFDYGDAVFEWHLAAYGPPNVLQKHYAMRVKVVSVVLDPTFPVSRTLQLSLTPAMLCSVNSGYGQWTCPANPIRMPALSVTLRPGEQTGWADLTLPFKQTPSPADGAPGAVGGLHGVAEFIVEPWQMDYAIEQCHDVLCRGSIVRGPGSSIALPLVRCDSGVIGPNRSGCVFPAAAAVMTMDGDKYPDIVAHIASAFAHEAPGRFQPKPDAPAVALLGNSTGWALHWAKSDAIKKANRRVACGTGESSVISTLKLLTPEDAYSPRCVAQPRQVTCSCDEFPFASTLEGAARTLRWSSARMVVASENSESGNDYGVFLGYQRVLPDSEWRSAEDFWIDLKPAAGQGAGAVSR